MEKLNIKLNDLSPIMCLLIEKIQLLDSYIVTRQQKLVCTKDLIAGVDNLRLFFRKATDNKDDEHVKIFVEKIERALSQFEWNTNVAVTPLEFNKFSENGKVLISAILKVLGTRGCGVLIIETYIKLCLKILSEMTETVESKNLSVDKYNFKLFLEGFSSAANMLKKYWHISLSNDQKNKIMLCLHQICKVLPYFLQLIKLHYTDMKKYLLSLLTKCLTRIQDEIHSDGNVKSSSHGQEFIAMMDFCLHKLNELSNHTNDFASFIEKANETVSAVRPTIDELLCSVMSIAHVTNFKDDQSAILGGCQKVLKELSELDNEIKEENGSAVKLNATSLGECLCSLEQKVNTAVLKLVLEVFSSVNSPLKNILNKCKQDIAKDNKASDDLNVLISEFDSEMDKIMQIGFFAISCTASTNRILGIESCLASLESLEAELVPSLTTLYVDCNAKNKANFQCLFDFWLNEITELKILIDSVLDPAGFCGVVRNQIKSLGLVFKEDISSPNVCLNKLKYNLQQVVRYSKKLLKTLKTSMEDENELFNKTTDVYLKNFHLGKTKFLEKFPKIISTAVPNLCFEVGKCNFVLSESAVQECEAAFNLMDQRYDTVKTVNQAIKRYDYLMLTLEKLSSHLFLLVSGEETNCEETENGSAWQSFGNMQIPKKNYYKLCEFSDVIDTATSSIPEILTPYVNKGILRSKKRNVLYTTPQKIDKTEDQFNKTILTTRHWDKTPISGKRSRCCKPLTLNLELENTIDLEVSTILENITQLSNSFSRTLQGNSDSQCEKKECSNCRDASCGLEKGTDDTKPTYTSSGCCAKLDREENVEIENGEGREEEKASLGFKLRSNFLQKLNDLSHTDSLSVVNENEAPSGVDSLERMTDLRIVEEKINFLKTRMPFGPL